MICSSSGLGRAPGALSFGMSRCGVQAIFADADVFSLAVNRGDVMTPQVRPLSAPYEWDWPCLFLCLKFSLRKHAGTLRGITHRPTLSTAPSLTHSTYSLSSPLPPRSSPAIGCALCRGQWCPLGLSRLRGTVSQSFTRSVKRGTL